MKYKKNYEHYGVAVIITNKNRNLFFIQKKDEGHPIPKFRNKYCFFGGAVEKNENELEALRRELKEETEEKIYSELIVKNSCKIFADYFLNTLNEKTKFSLYESVLEDKDLLKLSKSRIYEGSGELVKKNNLLSTPFLGDLKNLLHRYLESL